MLVGEHCPMMVQSSLPAETCDNEGVGIVGSTAASTDLSPFCGALIEGWLNALSSHDGASEGHSRRVTEVTLRVAKAMGLGDLDLVHVERGTLLHDIGKIGVPESILNKPGPLDETEWQLMRQHPSYAHDFLARFEFLGPALDIPLCHHERWDGQGYPRGLSGEDIPLPARICAAVDVWDALLSIAKVGWSHSCASTSPRLPAVTSIPPWSRRFS
jgi:HD-GYP domain-containing protein (c-di-GMP phosphodiesterase class II)